MDQTVNTQPTQVQNQVENQTKDKKSLLDKILGRLKKSDDQGSPPQQIKKTTQKQFKPPMKPMMKLMIFVAAVLVLILIFLLTVGLIMKAKNRSGDGLGALPTPSIYPFQQYTPSVFADDPIVKALQENISVLGNEISTTPLKETSLSPATYDFKINFNK